jgi:hypothetical protein
MDRARGAEAVRRDLEEPDATSFAVAELAARERVETSIEATGRATAWTGLAATGAGVSTGALA